MQIYAFYSFAREIRTINVCRKRTRALGGVGGSPRRVGRRDRGFREAFADKMSEGGRTAQSGVHETHGEGKVRREASHEAQASQGAVCCNCKLPHYYRDAG